MSGSSSSSPFSFGQSVSNLQAESVSLIGKRVTPCINHSYLNLCSAKIQFSALYKVHYSLYGYIYTSKSIHYLFVFRPSNFDAVLLTQKMVCIKNTVESREFLIVAV